VFVEEAREFVRALREKSRAPVHYLEMKGAQHAFEIFHSARSSTRCAPRRRSSKRSTRSTGRQRARERRPRDTFERCSRRCFAATASAARADRRGRRLAPAAVRRRRAQARARQRRRLPVKTPAKLYQPGSLQLEPELSAVEGDRAMLLGWMTGTTRAASPIANRYAFACAFAPAAIVEAWELLDSKSCLDQL
jgi:hypothetical protein